MTHFKRKQDLWKHIIPCKQLGINNQLLQNTWVHLLQQ